MISKRHGNNPPTDLLDQRQHASDRQTAPERSRALRRWPDARQDLVGRQGLDRLDPPIRSADSARHQTTRAARHLTRRRFGQILGRIVRLACRSGEPRVDADVEIGDHHGAR
jgi:hypothetical protein